MSRPRKKSRSKAVVPILVALPLMLTSCASPTKAPPEFIKIISLLPRTGSARIQTDFIVNSIRMALEECGYEAAGCRLEFEDVDTAIAACGWGAAIAKLDDAIDDAVSDPNVMVVIGTYNSGAAKVAIPRFNQAELLMISPANTWPGLTKPGKGDPGEPEKYRPGGKISYARVVPADDVQGSVGAEWAKKAGVRRVLVLHDRETYGKGVAERFRKRAEEIGLEVLGFESVDYEARDFKALMARIASSTPDLVYYGGTAQTLAGDIARELKTSGLACTLMVPDACFEEKFIADAGADNPRVRLVITFGAIPTEKLTGKGAEFAGNYRKKYGQDPENYAVYAYEAARVVLESIRRAGKKDREAIRAACLSIKDFDGALGRWSFDENGDTTLKTTSIYRVCNGRFQFVELMN